MENKIENINDTFKVLNDINLNNKIQEKIGLKYLSWAYAWGELKRIYPDATYTIYTRKVESEERIKKEDREIINRYVNEIPYFTDGRTCYVKVGVTINNVEYVELLPVMDNHNQSVDINIITMTAVNKAIQRAFVKACARHGLGLYIYAGEDLPEVDKKVIDFNALADTCNRFATVTLTEEGFEVLKANTIKVIQEESPNFPADAQKAITVYIEKNAKGKRLSLFTLKDDSVTLQRIYNFINEIKKLLAAPNGK